jgi:hypothetical protein
MREVYLIGVNHKYQLGLSPIIPVDATPGDFEEFRDLLRDVVARHDIGGIAEEMSVGGLRKHFIQGDSVPCILAGEIGLPHRYCDPDLVTREALGIKTPKEREAYWLEQLAMFDKFPALFISGADHINSFQSLLTDSGFRPFVVANDWESSSNAKRDLSHYFD